MATAVFFHAHPDDEAIATGGTMLLASRAGHRVVLVCATDGSVGETPGLSDEESDGIDLAAVRHAELLTAAEVLGVHQVVMLGYRDSGMDGDPANDHPESFWQADTEEASRRLARILTDEQAKVLTCYDSNGNYGHPDHIKVHRVGVLAAELAGVELVYEATINRQQFRDSMKQMIRIAKEVNPESAHDADFDEWEAALDSGAIGVSADRLTHCIDVRTVAAEKRQAMRAHRSQIPADSMMVALPDAAFEMAFGTEWYIRYGAGTRTTIDGMLGDDLFAPLRNAAVEP